MTRKAVKPGTKLREVFTTKFVNELIKPPPTTSGGGGFAFSTEHLIVKARCLISNDVINTYDPVMLSDHFSGQRSPSEVYNTLGGNPEIVPDCWVYVEPVSNWTTNNRSNIQWGIALDRITQSESGRVLLSGVTYLKLLNTKPTSNLQFYTGIDIVAGVMKYGLKGRAEIIGVLQANESHALVNLSKRTQTSVTAITTGTISPGGEGPANIEVPGGNPVTFAGKGTYSDLVVNPHRTKAVVANRRVVCNDIGGRWVIVFEECP